MTAEDLMRQLGSLEASAEVVEAIDDPLMQRRGWDLRGWRYELIPWGVRFVRRERDGSESEVFVMASVKDRLAEEPRPGAVCVVLSTGQQDVAPRLG